MACTSLPVALQGVSERQRRNMTARTVLRPPPDPDLLRFVMNLAIANARRDHLIATGQIIKDHDAARRDLRSVFHRPAERKIG